MRYTTVFRRTQIYLYSLVEYKMRHVNAHVEENRIGIIAPFCCCSKTFNYPSTRCIPTVDRHLFTLCKMLYWLVISFFKCCMHRQVLPCVYWFHPCILSSFEVVNVKDSIHILLPSMELDKSPSLILPLLFWALHGFNCSSIIDVFSPFICYCIYCIRHTLMIVFLITIKDWLIEWEQNA